MTSGSELLLIAAVVAVGILHTVVPDHWMPIALVARSSHWTRLQTARAAAVAGIGHTVSTLVIGLIVWLAGLALAVRFGNLVSLISSIALITFGLWIATTSLLEMRAERRHRHEHARGSRHEHSEHGAHAGKRTALLLILGSSPMVEGIPAFFAAAKYGASLLAIMAACFAVSTVATYIVLCVYSHAALERISLGPLERYGEVLSGATVALVGVVFLVWPLA